MIRVSLNLHEDASTKLTAKQINMDLSNQWMPRYLQKGR